MFCFVFGSLQLVTANLQLLLLKKLRPQVLHALHNTTTGGHFGVHKTLDRVREILLVLLSQGHRSLVQSL